MNEQTPISPDEAAVRSDLGSIAFRAGEFDGRWGFENVPGITWPYAVFWIGTANRPNCPSLFFLRLDLTGYPAQGPTGRLWDLKTGGTLALVDYPKGTGDTAKVFRTDWPSVDAAKGDTPGCALYHPFDRRAAVDHPNWKTEHPHQQWHAQRTVIDYLEMAYALLNSPTYTGVR